MSADTALVSYEAPGLVEPLADTATAKAAIQRYEALKAAIIQPKDIHKETRGDKTVEYLKKSFWRRIATCFGLSLLMVKGSEVREQDEHGKLAYSVFYQAVAPNGRTVEADGYCSRSEPGKQNWTEHSIRATAHTRAKNRAISDMVGGGETSYEEMHGDGEEEAPAPRPLPQRTVTPEPAPANGKAAHKWTDADRKALMKRWQALQPEGATPEETADLRGVNAFASALRAFLHHNAPFTDAERDRFAEFVATREARLAGQQQAPQQRHVIEETGEIVEDEPLTAEVEPVPFGLRDEPVQQGA